MAHSNFVGRAVELSVLDESLAALSEGHGGVLFVGGEPGIGKTRLLGEVAGRAGAVGRAVVAGKAYDLDGSSPYLPFIEAIRACLPGISDAASVALRTSAQELCLLVPELGAPPQVSSAGPALGPDGHRYRMFEAVADFFIATSKHNGAGLVLLLDDLQWADSTTLLMLQHLARKVAAAPILVVVAYRTTELSPDHPLVAILADLARDRLCKRLHLPPLTKGETSELVEGLTGAAAAPEFVSQLHEGAAGNPFFTEEMVRDLVERGADLSSAASIGQTIPEGIRDVIERRLARLSTPARATLQTAAVIGEAFPFAVLSAASPLLPDQLIDAVETAERAGMIREESDGYVFTHALVRRALYNSLSLARRWQLHERAAVALEGRASGGVSANLAIIGHHWRLGGHPERAKEYLLRSGDAALAMTAWSEAAGHWEFALECMEKTGESPLRCARLLEGLGDLYFLSSFEAQPSVDRYLRAAGMYEAAGEAVCGARARARAGRSLAYPTSGFDYTGALEHLRAAEAVLSSEPESVELGELYAAIAHSEAHALLHGPEEMLAAMQLVGDTAEKLDDEFWRDFLGVQSLHLKGHYLGLQGRLAEGLALETLAGERAAALKSKQGPVSNWPERWHELLLGYSSDAGPGDTSDVGSPQMARTHSRAGLANFTRNCAGWQSTDLYDPVRARERHEGIRDGQGRFMTPFLSVDLFLCGDIAELRRFTEEGTAVVSTINPEAVVLSRVMLSFAEGRWGDFRADYDERAERCKRGGMNGLALSTDRTLLRAARVIRDVELAGSLAEEALAVSLRSGAVKYEFIFRAELALLHGESGRLDEAETHLERCREILAAGEDWRGVRGRLALAQAVVAAMRRRAEESEAEFERAVDVFRSLTLPWDEAEAFELWARYGRRMRRAAGRQSFIAEKLADARRVYERIGAGQPWLDRLDGEAEELVAGPLRGHESRPDGLTVRELEVLRLVAAGRSSREIGSDLVLSVRTVERHVANIYLKTGTHGRAQVTSYAVAHGLGRPRE